MMEKKFMVYAIFLISGIWMLFSCSRQETDKSSLERKVDSLIHIMTLEEKIGQTYQVSGTGEVVEELIRKGLVGSVLNEVDPHRLNKIQAIAMEESRLGIPLIVGRDVIHGFKTIFPIPLGQAATWNPGLVEKAAAVAATEAASIGIHWTFAPMLDVSRDARWGRIAESFGEDPYLVKTMGASMIKGFQGDDLAEKNTIAACAKHFAAYGAAEGGRDYNTVDISIHTLYNVYLPPFKTAVEEGIATCMVSFNEINGIPSSGNEYLVRDVLKNTLKFEGFVVSDWASIKEMIDHGYVKDMKDAAETAIKAGVDMEMVSHAYQDNLKVLVKEGKLDEKLLDDAVRRILKVKYQLGLFEDPYVEESTSFEVLDPDHLVLARETAVQSLVLLKNENNVLPLKRDISKVAVLGPMADEGYEQLGTWIFDGEEKHSITPRKAITELIGSDHVLFEKALAYSRDKDESRFAVAVQIAKQAEVVIAFVGEESILSGEAHCRADITLPGKQVELMKALKSSGKKVIMVVMAGRPLALRNVEPYCDAILYAWHPGTMGGPAIADVLFGKNNPSGKLPVSFPSMSGQEPLYYNHKNTGRPASQEKYTSMDEIPPNAKQFSLGNTSHYIDAGFAPAYPFGYGLSYTRFSYNSLKLDKEEMSENDTLTVTVDLMNTGEYGGTEIVQLYLRDLVGSITRPVKELKRYQRVFLRAGEKKELRFLLNISDLAFYTMDLQWKAEPGDFVVFVGGNSHECLQSEFRLTDN